MIENSTTRTPRCGRCFELRDTQPSGVCDSSVCPVNRPNRPDVKDYPISYGAFELHVHQNIVHVLVYQPIVLAVLSAGFLGKIERALTVTQAYDRLRILVLMAECPAHELLASAYRIACWFAERHPFEFGRENLRIVTQDITAQDASSTSNDASQGWCLKMESTSAVAHPFSAEVFSHAARQSHGRSKT